MWARARGASRGDFVERSEGGAPSGRDPLRQRWRLLRRTFLVEKARRECPAEMRLATRTTNFFFFARLQAPGLRAGRACPPELCRGARRENALHHCRGTPASGAPRRVGDPREFSRCRVFYDNRCASTQPRHFIGERASAPFPKLTLHPPLPSSLSSRRVSSAVLGSTLSTVWAPSLVS